MSLSFDNNAYKKLFMSFPHLQNMLHAWTTQTIEELSASFQNPTKVGISSTAQKVLYDVVSPVLGDNVATVLVQELKQSARIISTHHLGIDCMAELAQSPHFLEMHKLRQSPETVSVIPILACSGIPLQSYSYPRGMMLSGNSCNKGFYRFPLFASALQDTIVYVTPKLVKSSVVKVSNKWKRDNVSSLYWDKMHDVLHNIILHDDCLNKESLSQQFMYINAKVYEQIYHENPNTHMVYIDLEEVTRQLVMHDLQDTNSILYTLFFTPELRRQLLEALIGERACWSANIAHGKSVERTGGDGTAFFWAVDAQGRRLPLTLVEGNDSCPYLSYGDMHIPFTADAIVEALEKKKLYCSLFTSFVSLHLEHFILCYGGVYMSKYLPIMLNAVRKIVDINPILQNKIASCPPFDALGSGLISVQYRNPENRQITPAGSIELLAHGGLSQSQLAEIAQFSALDLLPLTVQEWLTIHLSQNSVTGCGTWRGLVLGD